MSRLSVIHDSGGRDRQKQSARRHRAKTDFPQLGRGFDSTPPGGYREVESSATQGRGDPCFFGPQ